MRGGFLLKLLAWGIALTLVALPIVGVLNGWFASDRWPVAKLGVRAEFNHVSAEQIRAAAQPLLGDGFFAVKLHEVRAAVARLPWVERVEARKRWPDAIELVVFEQQPYARWGEDRLVNRRGEIFTVGKTQVAYFLRAGSLAKLAAVRGVCGSNPNGGPAYDPRTRRLFVPCRGDGVQMIDAAGHRLLPKLPRGDGPPIVLGSQVWVIDHSDGTLYGYQADTGRLLRSVRLGAQIPIFDGPSYAAGTLLIPTSTGVTALRGT